MEGLQCYYYDTELLFQNETVCFYVTNTNEITESSEINLYPNPVNNSFRIELDRTDRQIEQVSIISAMGSHLRLISKSDVEKEIDVTSLPSGFYYLLIELDNGNLVSKRLVKNGF